jgi:hypothetical protein
MHTCKKCNRPFPEGTDRRKKVCDHCRRNDPHRNGSRAAKLPKMFVSIDGEGAQEGDVMKLMTLSIGREDGTSATHVVGEDGVFGALHWLINQVSGHYKAADGQTYKQVPVAFHFGWDSAVLAKDFDPVDMFLVRKAQTDIQTPLCGATHGPDDVCKFLDEHTARQHIDYEATVFGVEADQQDVLPSVLHRYDVKDITKVITDGGEADVIAYHRPSQLALSITPGRRFYLEHRPNGDRYERWRRVDIHDTGRAFMGGLLKVISDWNPALSDRQREIIEWGKQRRTEVFQIEEIDKIIEYSEAECVAHARVCRILIDLIQDSAHVTIPEKDLFGSGAIAGAALKYYGAPRRKTSKNGVPGSDLRYEHIAQMTYFGGMIETPVVGLVEGLTDEVDINSAYPHKMIYIPCMREGCGFWGATDGTIPDGVVIGHAKVRWFIEEGLTSTPPFIVRRKDGRVAMPRMTDQWTWVSLAEYRAAIARFPGGIEVEKVIYWAPDCQCGREKPYEFLQYLYDKRLGFKDQMKTVEKESPEWWTLKCREQAIKLVINSIYGKLAQQDPQPGAYTNLHLASYITGATRAQVRAETWAREDQGGIVVYQHTDSVLSVGGNPQDGGKKLGAWGMEKQSKDFLIVQPGLATSLGGGKDASRGCRLGPFKEAVNKWLTEVDLTQHPTTWPKLVTEQKIMVSRRQAIAWGKPWMAGSFQDKITEISPVSPKRDIDNAEQMPGIPTAWVVPALDYIEDPATVEDVMRMRKCLGEWRTQKREAEDPLI